MDFKKKSKKTKVSAAPENGFVNSSFELNLDSDHNFKNNSKMLNTFRNKVEEVSDQKTALSAIIEAKRGAQRWKNYCGKKRVLQKSKAEMKKGASKNVDGTEMEGAKGQGLDMIDHDLLESTKSSGGFKKSNTMIASQTKALFDHFKELGRSKETDAVIDLEFVDDMLQRGASINMCDRHGQTLLHEVARMWHVDVAKFLVHRGANVNQPDVLGRTPLHVAAAVDYPEMCDVLIESGADKEAKTKGEKQTPVHYAAKNDATKSLKLLIKRGCLFEVRDYRGRTPLFVASQLDRSETAKVLLDFNAKATVRDDFGQVCLTWMIVKMPPVAEEALKQYWTCDRPNRKQYYDLHHMVHERDFESASTSVFNDSPEKDPQLIAVTPLAAAVNYKQYNLLMNKNFTKLIDVMWRHFARWRAWLMLVLNFIYILLWSLIGIFIEFDNRYLYIMPDHWWRIVLWVAALGFTLWQIIEEILEYKRSARKNYLWETQRTKEIEDDLQYCHPRWPEEAKFLLAEKEELNEKGSSYFSDLWNIFDWICYLFLLVCIGTHIADIAKHNTTVARAHIRLMAVTIILLWLRLMKNVRCFSLLGPFIVMLTHMLKDLFRFTFLYLEFYIPFVFAFFMIFGGDKIAYSDGTGSAENATVQGYETFNNALFSLFRLTMVDDYDFDGMTNVDPIMARILVGCWLALSAVLCLNLFIALLSDTFQRVYDNAQANAMMQKAQSILSFWESMSHNSRNSFLRYIYRNCSPLKEDYDDDMTMEDDEDLKKVTIQIKEQLDDWEEKWENKMPIASQKKQLEEDDEDASSRGISNEKFENEVEILRENIRGIQDRQEDMMDSVKAIKKLLLKLTGQDDDDDDDGDDYGGDGGNDRPPRGSKVKKLKKKKTRSKTPSADASIRDSAQHSGMSTPRVWTSGPVVDVSTPKFTSDRQFPGDDYSADC